MFFGNVWGWIERQITGYVNVQTAHVAALITPAVVTLAGVYVMVWGFAHLTGSIKEPLLEGFKRIMTIGILLGISTALWLYNGPIVDLFFNAPFRFSADLVGAEPIAMIDKIWVQGTSVAKQYWVQGGLLDGNVGFYMMALIVVLLVGGLCLYSMFLLALSKIALCVVLVLGPFFIAMLFFDTTKRFFEAWVAKLANYGMVAILTGVVSGLLLSGVADIGAQTVALGSKINIGDEMDFLLFSALVILLLMQVMPMAAGLASGIALTTHGAFGQALSWGLGTTRNTGRGAWDALTGQGTSRWDPVSRKAGYWPTRGAMSLTRGTIRPIWRAARGDNTVSRKSGS